MCCISFNDLKQITMELGAITFPFSMHLYKNDKCQCNQLLVPCTTSPHKSFWNLHDSPIFKIMGDVCQTKLQMKDNLGNLCMNRASCILIKISSFYFQVMKEKLCVTFTLFSMAACIRAKDCQLPCTAMNCINASVKYLACS